MRPYWQSSDGRLVIYHGDCREVLPTLGSPAVDLVLTDPPFNVGFDYGTGRSDALPIDEYGVWLRSRLDIATEQLVSGGWVFCWMAMKHCRYWHEWFPDGWRIFAAARNFTQFLPTPIQYSWDPVIFWQQVGVRTKGQAGVRDFHVGNTARWVAQKANGHPCPRPLDTAQYIISIVSSPGGVVLDPFMGSGTTLDAAQSRGRRAIGIEIEERYCEIAVKRLEDPPMLAAMKAEQLTLEAIP